MSDTLGGEANESEELFYVGQDPYRTEDVLDDGFGNQWHKCEKPDCGLEIVRPGKVQCWCDNKKETVSE